MEKHGFYCPHCRQQMSDHDPDSEHTDTVRFWGILTGKFFSIGSYVKLSSKINVYGGIFENEGLEVESGALVEFHCPFRDCRHPLEASYNKELSEVHWYGENGEKHVVAFHNTLGKEMTFIIDLENGELIASHGKDHQEILNRWAGYSAWR